MSYVEQYGPLIDKIVWTYSAKIFAPLYENDYPKVMMGLKQFDEFVTNEVMDALSTENTHNNAAKKADEILNSILHDVSMPPLEQVYINIIHKHIVKSLS